MMSVSGMPELICRQIYEVDDVFHPTDDQMRRLAKELIVIAGKQMLQAKLLAKYAREMEGKNK